jgi:hypothetical protein
MTETALIVVVVAWGLLGGGLCPLYRKPYRARWEKTKTAAPK